MEAGGRREVRISENGGNSRAGSVCGESLREPPDTGKGDESSCCIPDEDDEEEEEDVDEVDEEIGTLERFKLGVSERSSLSEREVTVRGRTNLLPNVGRRDDAARLDWPNLRRPPGSESAVRLTVE